MAGDYILAIDQGTTSSRAIVFNHDSATVGEAQQEFTQHYPKPGWVEHDANEIWDVTLGVMRQALEDAGVSPGDIAAIGITNQRETVVMWDKETGEPVHNAIVWQDRRGAQICTELSEAGLRRDGRQQDRPRHRRLLLGLQGRSGSWTTWTASGRGRRTARSPSAP